MNTASLIINVVAVVAVLLLSLSWLRRRKEQGEELQPAGDATRYALANAVLGGSLFRQRVLRLARNKYRATAPELGIDMPLLIRACRHYENIERGLNWTIVLLLVAIVGVPVLMGIIFSMAQAYDLAYEFMRVWAILSVLIALSVFGLAFFKQWRERFQLVSAFRRENYDVGKIDGALPITEADERIEVEADPNVVCYGRSQPFVGFGVETSQWQISADCSRPNPAPQTLPPQPISVSDVYDAVTKNVTDLNIANLSVHDVVFVNGSESHQLRELQPGRLVKPRTHISEESMKRYLDGLDPRARAYRLFQITDWNGELVFSYFFRCVRRGEALSVESVQRVLAPVARKYREIDRIRLLGFFGLIRWWLLSLPGCAIVIFSAFVSVAMQIREAIYALFGGEDAAEKREIMRNYAYNYGARESVREIMAADNYHVHFQRVDCWQYMGALDMQVSNAFADLLEAKGVDVSHVRARASVVLNNGVMIGAGSTISGAVAGAGGAAKAITGAAAGAVTQGKK